MPIDLDDKGRRRSDRFDLWLFVSVWLAVGVITGIALIATLP
jgi:hypothetical protein